MSVVDDVPKVVQDFLALELREIKGQLVAMVEINRIRHEARVQRLEQIQQSFAFDKCISSLEAEKTRTV